MSDLQFTNLNELKEEQTDEFELEEEARREAMTPSPGAARRYNADGTENKQYSQNQASRRFNLMLIRLVRDRPELYDLKCPAYKSAIDRDRGWKEVAKACNQDQDFVRTRWKTMRDRFKKECRKFETNQPVNWTHFREMYFLQPFFRFKHSRQSQPNTATASYDYQNDNNNDNEPYIDNSVDSTKFLMDLAQSALNNSGSYDMQSDDIIVGSSGNDDSSGKFIVNVSTPNNNKVNANNNKMNEKKSIRNNNNRSGSRTADCDEEEDEDENNSNNGNDYPVLCVQSAGNVDDGSEFALNSFQKPLSKLADYLDYKSSTNTGAKTLASENRKRPHATNDAYGVQSSSNFGTTHRPSASRFQQRFRSVLGNTITPPPTTTNNNNNYNNVSNNDAANIMMNLSEADDDEEDALFCRIMLKKLKKMDEHVKETAKAKILELLVQLQYGDRTT